MMNKLIIPQKIHQQKWKKERNHREDYLRNHTAKFLMSQSVVEAKKKKKTF